MNDLSQKTIDKTKHYLVFVGGVLVGLLVTLVIGSIFFPYDTREAVTFSLSGLTNAEQSMSLLHPMTAFHSIFQGSSILTDQGVIVFTNAARASNATGTASGIPLKPLTENTVLDKVALEKAQDMFTNQYFEHISPVTGNGPSDLDTSAGYSYIIVGENLAEGNFASDQDLVTAWMNSPGHRANILDDRYQDIGVAVLRGKYKGNTVWMAVQEFGLPSSACPTASADLLSKISANKLELATEDSGLNTMKHDLGSLDPSNNTYAVQAEKYNEQVAEYNSLIITTANMVSQYNAEVSAHNICAQAK